MAEIKFYFDFMSPYSCLAWQWMTMQKKLLESCSFYPISMGSLISSFETKGPAQIPVKRDYLFKAALRAAKKNNLYLEVPIKLPFNSVLVQRLAQRDVSGDQQFLVIDRVFKGIWRDGIDVEDPEQLQHYLNLNGLSLESCTWLFERSSTKDARLEQRKNQSYILEAGGFGVPTFAVDEEIFWGFDAREDLLNYLQNADTLEQKKFKQFIKLFP